MRLRILGVGLIGIALLIGATLVALLLLDQTAPPQPTPTAEIYGGTPMGVYSTHFPTFAPIVSPSPTAAADVPASMVYIVQEGDTLSHIAFEHGVAIEELMEANQLADPNLIHPGQTLIIPLPSTLPEPTISLEPLPEATRSSEPTPTPLPTPTPVGPPLVEIGEIIGAGDLQSEIAVIRNSGGLVDLTGWTLSDRQGNFFIFPRLYLFPNAEVRVHSAPGTNLPTDLYWGRARAAWSSGELLTLRDARGEIMDTYVVP